MLMGHLGGKAYSLRSAIITALGHLVHKAFERIPGEDADAQGKASRLSATSLLLQAAWVSIILTLSVANLPCNPGGCALACHR